MGVECSCEHGVCICVSVIVCDLIWMHMYIHYVLSVCEMIWMHACTHIFNNFNQAFVYACSATGADVCCGRAHGRDGSDESAPQRGRLASECVRRLAESGFCGGQSGARAVAGMGLTGRAPSGQSGLLRI